MNNAKNSGGKRTPRHGRRLGFGRQVLLLAALAVIAMGVVGGTVAYLVTKTSPVENTFVPGYVSCRINEKGPDGEKDFENNVDTEKKNVTVTNTGIVDAYIRAAIIVTWKDSSGNIAATVPVEGYDYNLKLNTNNWTHRGEYYYYQRSVEQNGTPEKLVESCTALKSNGDYTLSVEILADAIQSSPDSAVTQAWGNDALNLVK